MNNINSLLEGNKYFKWYWSICNRAKDRFLSSDIYVEKHHIYPKSIYGINDGLVKLTAKEHYIVHLLLWWGLRTKYGTQDENTRKMAHAFRMMNLKTHNRQCYNSKNYSFLKIVSVESQKGLVRSEKTREKISRTVKLQWETKEFYGMKNKNHSDESKEKISKNRIGMIFTDEHKENLSKSHMGHTVTDETRLKMLESGKNNITDEIRLKMSERSKGDKNPMYGKSVYSTWVEKYGIEEANIRECKRKEKEKITKRLNKIKGERKDNH